MFFTPLKTYGKNSMPLYWPVFWIENYFLDLPLYAGLEITYTHFKFCVFSPKSVLLGASVGAEKFTSFSGLANLVYFFKFSLFLTHSIAFTETSTPIHFLFNISLATQVVAQPQNGSKTTFLLGAVLLL